MVCDMQRLVDLPSPSAASSSCAVLRRQPPNVAREVERAAHEAISGSDVDWKAAVDIPPARKQAPHNGLDVLSRVAIYRSQVVSSSCRRLGPGGCLGVVGWSKPQGEAEVATGYRKPARAEGYFAAVKGDYAGMEGRRTRSDQEAPTHPYRKAIQPSTTLESCVCGGRCGTS